jgi:hypothetical protein
LLAKWQAAGLDDRDFWRRTPKELSWKIEAQQDIFARQHNERAWLAWHIGALVRAQKKYPRLDSMLVNTKPRQLRRVTSDQLYEQIKAWHLARGGKIVKKAES